MAERKSKHPHLAFEVFTVLVQTVIWVLFCIYDYFIDEQHAKLGLDNEISQILWTIIILLPILTYHFLNKKYFTSEKIIRYDLFQIGFWMLAALAVSVAIYSAVKNDAWLIKQSPTILQNGIEYLIIPGLNAFCALLLVLFKLIPDIFRHLRGSKDNDTTEG